MKISVFACLSFCGILINKKKINELIQNLLGFRVFWSFTFCFAILIFIFCLFVSTIYAHKKRLLTYNKSKPVLFFSNSTSNTSI